MYDVQLELSDHWKNLEVKVLVADVANRSRMEAIFKQYMPQLVFHAAAYKNISMLEDYAAEALQVNVLGTKNIADLAIKYKVYKSWSYTPKNEKELQNAGFFLNEM